MTPHVTQGWRPFFSQQLTLEELETTRPARVLQRIGEHLTMLLGREERTIRLPRKWLELPPVEQPIVGDWVLLDEDNLLCRLLDRTSLLQRRAAGEGERSQLMATNVDTLFIVSALDRDFNLSRIERYLALALEAAIAPVILLTKADLNENHEKLRRDAERLSEKGVALSLDGRDTIAVSSLLAPWIGEGETVVFMGSSGVGKSTLINSLLHKKLQETKEISGVDERGRHTTTQRAMFPLTKGGWLIDTPGMRQLRLGESSGGLGKLFSDIEDLASRCKFNNCAHEQEPDCVVRVCVESGELDSRRLENYRKLQREQSKLQESTHERRGREKGFGRVVKEAKNFKKGE